MNIMPYIITTMQQNFEQNSYTLWRAPSQAQMAHFSSVIKNHINFVSYSPDKMNENSVPQSAARLHEISQEGNC
jgi:hypothetical protein